MHVNVRLLSLSPFYYVVSSLSLIRTLRPRLIVTAQVDMPGHADGLLPLKHYGGEFCASSQMYADAAGGTNRVLTALVKEYSALFGSQVCSPSTAFLNGFVSSLALVWTNAIF